MKTLKLYLLLSLGLTLALPVFSQVEHRKLLLRDEGTSQLAYIDIANPSDNWYIKVPYGRDMQLVGQGRVLIGTGDGYEERLISNGEKVYELTSYPGTISARRLRNGNTLLVGANWQEQEGIVLVEVDSTGSVQRKIVYPGFKYVRLVRETPSGTFLVTANNNVFEGDAKGNVLWKAEVKGHDNPHAWQAVRIGQGQTLLTSGYAANIQVLKKNGSAVITTITGPEEVHPHFYAGFQILPNGNIVVINWQGHGTENGNKGVQLLEYTPKGKLVWSWKQDPSKLSSMHAVIVLDGLDLDQLYVENANGVLSPVHTQK